MRRTRKRVLVMMISLIALVIVFALVYKFGMTHLEGEPRSFKSSLEWVSETLTSTGYGRDNSWTHPAMVAFVIVVQFVGSLLIFLVVPVLMIPFIEERFEERLVRNIPCLKGRVLIYRFDPAVASLVNELSILKVPFVILEEDESRARRLRDRGLNVVFANLEKDDPELTDIEDAMAIIANGRDQDNAVLTLLARQRSFTGPIVALVNNPYRRAPMMRAGATATFTPIHVLAAAIAGKASSTMSPVVEGVQHLGARLKIAEIRIHKHSALCGKTLAESDLRKTTGATVIGQWRGGELTHQVNPSAIIRPGTILVVVGNQESLEKLGEIARPHTGEGPILVLGGGELAEKTAELLKGVGEDVRRVCEADEHGVDFVGDVVDPDLLRSAGIETAGAAVVCLDGDNSGLFATSVVRDLAPEVVIITSVERPENVERMHRAGADFAMSVSQVAGQLLAFHVLGEESVELQPQLKVTRCRAGELAGRDPVTAKIQQRTGCQIVAVERGTEIIVHLAGGFRFEAEDRLYLFGSPSAVSRFFDQFPASRG